MSKDLYMTNDNNLKSRNDEGSAEDFIYLNKRLSYLERVIQSKYSDILYLASEICNVQNMNLKYDLIDILIKHGYNLSRYKAEAQDIKDMMGNLKHNSSESQNHIVEKDIDIEKKDIDKIKPHDINDKDENDKETIKEANVIIETTGSSEYNENSDPIIKPFNDGPNDDNDIGSKKNKLEIARQKILNNLDKLISYKENTFNDLIEMVDFNINSNSNKVDLSKFIENLENQIVELNGYKDNILKNHSLSKSIELSSNGKITFPRVFIEKERLIDKDKDEYIRVVTEMHELYSEFVDSYLQNINYMKPHLDPNKINSMQNNCAKVIYDLKLIKNLYASLDKIKSV